MMLGLEVLIAVASLLWHPFHVSVAEGQWNADGSRLQVALRLSPADLDATLSEVHGRRIELERESPERKQQLLTEYLRDAIYLSETQEAAKDQSEAVVSARHERFVWVGLEDEVRYLWVYFELKRESPVGHEGAVPAGGNVWLTNRVMVEAEATQINTLQLIRAGKPIAIRTTKETPTKELPIILPVEILPAE